jgi:uncharacterized protein (TIGR02452 family)
MQNMSADIFLMRIQVWQETANVAAKLHDVLPSVKWTSDTNIVVTRPFTTTVIQVVNADCIDLGRHAMLRGLNPVILNLSDDFAAGGAVQCGSGAQEESLWRRTALCRTQTQQFYPLCASGQHSLIYSPKVHVLREPESRGYAWLSPIRMDFIACPALKYPRVIHDASGNKDLSVEDKRTLADRLRFILRVANACHHDSIILGAMGCGAWKNPPKVVAEIFATVLPEFKSCFREITVAILSQTGLDHVFAEALTPVSNR